MKIYTLTLGFCPWRVLDAGMDDYYSTAAIKPDRHYFLDQHYPMGREDNLVNFKRICDRHGIAYIDSGHDRGMCEGWNMMMDIIPFESGDVLIGYDPDAKPLSKGWDKAMIDVLKAASIFDIVATSQSFTNEHIYPVGVIQGTFSNVAKQNIFRVNLPSLDMMTVTAARWELLKDRKLVSGMAYWGGTESTVRDWMIERGTTYCYLLDHQENNGNAHLGDIEYRHYKDALIKGYQESFEEYLKAGYK